MKRKKGKVKWKPVEGEWKVTGCDGAHYALGIGCGKGYCYVKDDANANVTGKCETMGMDDAKTNANSKLECRLDMEEEKKETDEWKTVQEKKDETFDATKPNSVKTENANNVKLDETMKWMTIVQKASLLEKYVAMKKEELIMHEAFGLDKMKLVTDEKSKQNEWTTVWNKKFGKWKATNGMWAKGGELNAKDEEEMFRKTWNETGLTEGSDYFDVPLMKAKNGIRNVKSTGKVWYCGEQFEVHDVKDDGNCMFRAISAGKYGDEEKHNVIRTNAMKWLEQELKSKDRDLVLAQVVAYYADKNALDKMTGKLEKDTETMLNDMKRNGTWGGEMSLVALSEMLNVSFVVFDVMRRSVKRISGKEGKMYETEMYLRYVNLNHYQLMIPLSKRKNTDKKVMMTFEVSLDETCVKNKETTATTDMNLDAIRETNTGQVKEFKRKNGKRRKRMRVNRNWKKEDCEVHDDVYGILGEMLNHIDSAGEGKDTDEQLLGKGKKAKKVGRPKKAGRPHDKNTPLKRGMKTYVEGLNLARSVTKSAEKIKVAKDASDAKLRKILRSTNRKENVSASGDNHASTHKSIHRMNKFDVNDPYIYGAVSHLMKRKYSKGFAVGYGRLIYSGAGKGIFRGYGFGKRYYAQRMKDWKPRMDEAVVKQKSILNSVLTRYGSVLAAKKRCVDRARIQFGSSIDAINAKELMLRKARILRNQLQISYKNIETAAKKLMSGQKRAKAMKKKRLKRLYMWRKIRTQITEEERLLKDHVLQKLQCEGDLDNNIDQIFQELRILKMKLRACYCMVSNSGDAFPKRLCVNEKASVVIRNRIKKKKGNWMIAKAYVDWMTARQKCENIEKELEKAEIGLNYMKMKREIMAMRFAGTIASTRKNNRETKRRWTANNPELNKLRSRICMKQKRAKTTTEAIKKIKLKLFVKGRETKYRRLRLMQIHTAEQMLQKEMRGYEVKPGWEQEGPKYERLKKHALWKETAIRRLLKKAEYKLLSYPADVQEKLRCDYKVAIENDVELMIGLRTVLAKEFWNLYGKLQRKVSGWKSEVEGIQLHGDDDEIQVPQSNVTWEMILRPPNSRVHRQYQKEVGWRYQDEILEDGAECTDSCKLPDQWAERCGEKLKALPPKVNAMTELFEAMEKLELCEDCVPNRPCGKGIDGCEDIVRMLLAVRPHSTVVGNLLTHYIYPVFRVMSAFIETETVMYTGTLFDVKRTLERLMKDKMKQSIIDEERRLEGDFAGPATSANAIKEQFGQFADKFRAKENDHPIEVCFVCERNVKKRDIEVTTKNLKNKNKASKTKLFECLSRLIEIPEEDDVESFIARKKMELIICRTCWTHVRSGKIAGPMYENAMWVDPIPDVLESLNYFEKMLVERTRLFYTVVKLETCSGKKKKQWNRKNLVEAVRGNAVHLWMPTGETSSYVLNTLPSVDLKERMRIFVRSLPIGDKLYKNIVDMKKVLKALAWLKANNDYYKDVEIDFEASKRIDWDNFVKDLDEIEKETEKEMKKKQNELEKRKRDVTSSAVTQPLVKRKQNADAVIDEQVDEPPRKRRKVKKLNLSAAVQDEQVQTHDKNIAVEGQNNDDLSSNKPTAFEVKKKKRPKKLHFTKAAAEDAECDANGKIGESILNLPGCGKKRPKKLSLKLSKETEDPNMAEKPVHTVANSDTGNAELDVLKAPEMEPMLSNTWSPSLDAEYVIEGGDNIHLPAGEHVETYQQKRLDDSNTLFMAKTKGMDCMSLPYVYPTGYGGFDDPNRKKAVRLKEFCQYRAQHSSGRFRKNARWCQMMHFHKRERAILQGLYASTKTGAKLTKLKAGKLREKLEKKDMDVERDLTMALGAVKGTKEYWTRECGNLRIMDEEFGPATFFLTLSCAEYNWEELHRYLRLVNKDVKDIDKMSKEDLIKLDPLTVSEYFMRRFKAFMDEVLMPKDEDGTQIEGALGFVEHFYWRLEYQARGAPHIHMKLWIKDAPIMGRSTNEEVLEFIAKYIRADLPAIAENVELSRLVEMYQVHRCTNSCMKSSKGRSGNFSRRCRYGFPQQPCKSYVLNNVEDSIISRRRGSAKTRNWYEVPRGTDDKSRRVNPYNPVILNLWQANMDIRFVGEYSNVLNSYITGYITKSEKRATEDLWDAISEDKSVPGSILSIVKRTFKDRDVGMYEIGDDLLGHQLHGSSDSVVFVGAGMPDKRTRRLKKFDDLKKLKAESDDILCTNFVENYYVKRGEELEDVCMHEIASRWKYGWIKKGKDDKSKKDDDESGDENMADDQVSESNDYVISLDGKMFFKRLRKRKLVKTRYVVNKPGGEEAYFQMLLQLFVPYRNEDELKAGKDTFKEAFEYWCTKETIGTRLKSRHEMKEQMRLVIDAKKRLEERAAEEDERDAANLDEIEMDLDNVEVDVSGNAMKGSFRDVEDYCTEDGHARRLSLLNDKQRLVYDKVIKATNHTLAHDLDTCKCNEKAQLLLFVSGGAGVGKSKVIETVTEGLEMLYKKVNSKTGGVILTAPTGMAANNIGGKTVHSVFKFRPNQTKRRAWEYEALRTEEAKSFYAEVGKDKTLIIDEISMVSNKTLAFTHCRLCELKRNINYEVPFGGRNVIVFGDLLQLPPINDEKKGPSPYCFMNLTKNSVLSAFPGSASGRFPVNLWKSFDYVELTENMRQKDDKEYADMLNTLRVGKMTDEIENKLKERVVKLQDEDIEDVALKLFKEKKNPVCLFAKRKQVTKVNVNMVLKQKLSWKLSHAVEARRHIARKGVPSCNTSSERNVMDYMMKKSENDTRMTLTLPSVLMVGKGIRVMLVRNLDVEKGLYNGATGIITKVVENHTEPDGIGKIKVKFDNVDEEVEVERVSEKYSQDSGLEVNRVQFPLVLSYAMTVHKCQGLSLSHVISDLGPSIFAPGMAYVVLSRLRKFEGLYLTKFDKNSIFADKLAVIEYNRLRNTYTNLPELDIPKPRKYQPKMPDNDNLFSTEEAQKIAKKVSKVTAKASQISKTKKISANKAPASNDNTNKTEATKNKKTPAKRKLTFDDDADKMSTLTNASQIKSGKPKQSEQRERNLCFVEAALRALKHAKSFTNWLMGCTGSRNLKKLMKGNEIKELTKEVDGKTNRRFKFCDGKGHDSYIFLKCLLEASAPEENMWCIDEKKKYTCGQCSVEKESKEHKIGIDLTVPDGENLKINFGKCLNDVMQQREFRGEYSNKKCPKCDQNFVLEESQLLFSQDIKLLIIRLLWYFEAGGLKLKSTGRFQEIPTEGVVLNGKRLDIKSIVVFEKDEAEEYGHYYCIKKSGNIWFKYDENIDPEEVEFPKTLENVYYLVCDLEDCQFQPQPKGLKEIKHNKMKESVVLQMTTNWYQTGLNSDSDYYNVPIVACENGIKDASGIQFERLCGDTFTVYDSDGDGNCLFRAVSMAVFGTQKQHNIFRKLASSWLLEHWRSLDVDNLKGVMIDVKEKQLATKMNAQKAKQALDIWEDEMNKSHRNFEKSIQWLAAYLGTDKVWGGEESLQFLSKALDVSMVVIDVVTGSVWRTLRDEPIKKAEIYLRFAGRNHYQLMEPHGKNQFQLRIQFAIDLD